MKTKSIFKTLNFRFTFFAFLLIVLPMLIALAVTGAKLRNDYRKTILNDFAKDLRTKVFGSNKLLNMPKGDIRVLATHFGEDLKTFPEQAKGLETGAPPAEFYKSDLYRDMVMDLEEEMGESEFYLQGRVFNASGWEIVRINRRDSGLAEVPPEELQNKSHRYYFKHIMKGAGKKVHVMPISLKREHRKIIKPYTPFIRIGKKIMRDDGTVFGMALLNVHTDLIFSLPIKEKTGFLAIDEEGTYVHHWNKAVLYGKDLGHPANLLVEEPELKANLGKQDSRIHYDPELKEFRVWEKSFFDEGDSKIYWVFMERHSEASIVSPWMSVAQKGLFSLAAILVMGFLIFTWFLRKNLSPMKELHNGIEELKMGNLMARVPVKSQTEIGEVAAAFNSMAEKLETTDWDLHRTMALIRSIGKIAPNAHIITDVEGIIISVNPATEKIFEYEAKELLGQNVNILMPSPHKERHDEYLRNYLKTGTGNVMGKAVELEGVKKNGHRFPISLYVGDSRVVGDRVFVGIIEDITERKKAEINIKSLAKFPSENPGPVLRASNDTKILYSNEAGTLLLDSWGVKVGQHLPKYVGQYLSSAFDAKEVEIKCGDNLYSLLFRKLPEEGYLNIYGKDVTLRKQAEENLKASEERVRLLLDSTGEGILGLDIKGKIEFLNPAAVRMLGYENAEQLLGKNAHAMIHHTDEKGAPYPETECPVYISTREGKDLHVDDKVFWRADGASFPVEYWACPIRRGGKTIGTVITFLDVTERKKIQEELQRNMDKLRQFNRRAVGRELKMAELKAEVNELLRRLKQEEKYTVRKPKT